MEENLNNTAGAESIAPTTAPVSGGQDANSIATTPSASNTQNGNSSVTDDYKQKYEASVGKISALEKERNEYSQKYKEAETKAKSQDRIVAGLNRTFSKNKSAYEEFRTDWKEKTGQDLGEYEQLYGTPSTNISSNQQTTQQPALGSNIPDPDTIATQVEERLKQREQMKSFETDTMAFVKKHDDLDPEKIDKSDPANVQKAKEKFAYIADAAVVRKSHHPNETWEEAYENIYYSQPEVRAQLAQQAQLTGQKIGKATNTNSGAAVGRAPTGDNQTITLNKSYFEKMSPQQKARYDKLVAGGQSDLANKIAKRIGEGIGL